MLKFISFGSGSSGNCYYLYTETDGLIIDIGVGIRTLKKHFRDYGLSLSSIHYVLITHDHADHIKSVGSISHEYHLPIYATKNVHDGIDRNYCVARKLPAQMKRSIVPGEPMQLGCFHVTPFSVPHDATENVGYQVEVEGVTFCIITDAGCVTDEMKDYIGMLYGVKKKDRIFTVTKSYLHHEMDRGAKEAEVKRIRIHDLRHSHISLLIDMGFSAVAIAERVGHESIDITYNYAHLFPSRQQEMAKKLDIERTGEGV